LILAVTPNGYVVIRTRHLDFTQYIISIPSAFTNRGGTSPVFCGIADPWENRTRRLSTTAIKLGNLDPWIDTLLYNLEELKQG